MSEDSELDNFVKTSFQNIVSIAFGILSKGFSTKDVFYSDPLKVIGSGVAVW